MTKIYRLIEYIFTDPAHMQEVLRRSLVGTLDVGNGTITATIVDSLDSNQEDRLKMARMQPGVWLSNPGAMTRWKVTTLDPQLPMISLQEGEARALDYFERAQQERERMEQGIPPFVAKANTDFAQMIATTYGLKLAHTLALALSNIAPELEANSEPEKFISDTEALAIAEALMAQIPDDWQGDQPPVADDGPGGV